MDDKKISKIETGQPGEVSQPVQPEQPVEVRPEAEAHASVDEAALQAAVEKLDADENSVRQATAQAQQMQSLPQDEQIKQLLAIAQKKGVLQAVQVAKKMDNAYVLDMLHDQLAKAGLYKDLKL